jgi:hypothetical protein
MALFLFCGKWLPAMLQVHFTASKTLCDVHIGAVENTQTGEPIKYGSKTVLVTDGYSVE